MVTGACGVVSGTASFSVVANSTEGVVGAAEASVEVEPDATSGAGVVIASSGETSVLITAGVVSLKTDGTVVTFGLTSSVAGVLPVKNSIIVVSMEGVSVVDGTSVLLGTSFLPSTPSGGCVVAFDGGAVVSGLGVVSSRATRVPVVSSNVEASVVVV